MCTKVDNRTGKKSICQILKRSLEILNKLLSLALHLRVGHHLDSDTKQYQTSKSCFSSCVVYVHAFDEVKWLFLTLFLYFHLVRMLS